MDIKRLNSVALSVRSLTMDAVQKAASGHPGLPMGCAELGSLIYCEILEHFPTDPTWINRDRFVLSAGHGSMLLYALLHLTGYDLTLEDIKSFRQLGSKTPGHPEYGVTPGVETTTGPLGQGLANAVGLAIAERILSSLFNTEKYNIIDHYTYVLASDGDMMEGVSSEAASLAGHLGLGKLIVFYDSNNITIEGSTDLAFSEDVSKRFAAYNWHTQDGSAYDVESILQMVEIAKGVTDRPSLIKLDSVIAQGAPNMAGSHTAHGAPLGEEEISAAKEAMGVEKDNTFYIDPQAIEYIEDRRVIWKRRYDEWFSRFDEWKKENPDLHREWNRFFDGNTVKENIAELTLPEFKEGETIATRAAGGAVLNCIADQLPFLYGGSADLAPSNSTHLKGKGDFSRENPLGRNFHFGVREHAMGSISNGMCLYGGLRPFCATFLVFSDYMRPPIRLAAMMKLPIIYVFTHDSIFVGEDGPTHQPVEQIAALRAIPGLINLRPGDAQETEMAWQIALERQTGPACLFLSRQKIEVYRKDDPDWKRNIHKGAYIVRQGGEHPETVIIATGSEVSLALQAVDQISANSVRIISMISRELFSIQDEAYRKSLIPENTRRIVFEAGVTLGWEGFTDEIMSLQWFGESGKGSAVGEHLGISSTAVLNALQQK